LERGIAVRAGLVGELKWSERFVDLDLGLHDPLITATDGAGG